MATADLMAVLCRRPLYKHIVHDYKPKPTRETIDGAVYEHKSLSSLDNYVPPPIIRPCKQDNNLSIDFADIAKRAFMRADRNEFALSLGVSVESCDLLRVGQMEYWLDGSKQLAWSIPMRDENLKIIGIRLRFPCKSKRAVKGSSAGLITPAGLKPSTDTLYITEGESDALAGMSMGLEHVIGKPGRTAANKFIVDYLAKAYRDVVIISDRDRDGYVSAVKTANLIKNKCRSVKVILPKADDLRDWYSKGATKEDLIYISDNTKRF